MNPSSLQALYSPLSAASSQPGHSSGSWVYIVRPPASQRQNVGLDYAHRLLLLAAGVTSLYPGVIKEMNYAARRQALLVLYSTATEPSIFSRIRYIYAAAGDPVLIRTIVSFLLIE